MKGNTDGESANNTVQ